MVIRGRGQVLIGAKVSSLKTLDVVTIPASTWHQFQASRGEALGFLCMVSTKRDRPQRPAVRELEQLKKNQAVAGFIKI